MVMGLGVGVGVAVAVATAVDMSVDLRVDLDIGEGVGVGAAVGVIVCRCCRGLGDARAVCALWVGCGLAVGSYLATLLCLRFFTATSLFMVVRGSNVLHVVVP